MAVTITNRPISSVSPFAARHKWAKLAAEAAKTAVSTSIETIENRALVSEVGLKGSDMGLDIER